MPKQNDRSLIYRFSNHQTAINRRAFPALITAIFVAILLSSCGGVHVIRYEEEARPTKPFDFAIPILNKANIHRPYKIIGLIQIDASQRDNEGMIIEQLKTEARRLGGDALIDLQQQPQETHFPIGGTFPLVSQGELAYSGHFRDLWTAKVIVWQNP